MFFGGRYNSEEDAAIVADYFNLTIYSNTEKMNFKWKNEAELKAGFEELQKKYGSNVSERIVISHQGVIQKKAKPKSSMYVDGAEMVLDVEPILYNNRTYIPVRFVAESMGKNVGWDEETKTVIIFDEGMYDTVKNILDKSISAVDNINKFKTEVVLRENNIEKGKNIFQVDKEKRIMYFLQNDNLSDTYYYDESFLKDNVQYTRTDPNTSEWIKQDMTDQSSLEEIQDKIQLSYLAIKDILKENFWCALVIDKSLDQNEIVLSGIACISVEEVLSIRITLEKDTYRYKRIALDGLMSVEFDGKPKHVNPEALYSDYNSDFEIVPPEGIE